MNMWLVIAIVVVGTAIFLASIFINEDGGNKSSEPSYKAKQSVMNQSESAFFFELQKQLPNGYYIFPKMRIADMLDIPNGHDYYRMRNKALPKHIDFLICDKYFKPVIAIELNGASHGNSKQQEIDKVKNEMFKDSGLPLEIINVGDNFSVSIDSINQKLGVNT